MSSIPLRTSERAVAVAPGKSRIRLRKSARSLRPGNLSTSCAAFKSSRYTFAVPVQGATLLYNANSGAVIKLAGPDAAALAAALAGPPRPFVLGASDALLCGQLVAGGFLIPAATNEIVEIRERYWRARRETPMTLTITTTMDCNLGCYYCYEDRSDAHLQQHDIAAIVAHAEDRLQRHGRRTLHVDWYGGEPLLNLSALEAGSAALQALCARLGVGYGASIVSNGTAWPDDVGAFVSRHRLRQVQISFDGLAAHHDKRRRYRQGRAPETSASSFARAVSVVDALLEYVRVDVRLNLDRQNQSDLIPFVEFMRQRGWFTRPFPAVFQVARVSAFSERSAFLRQHEIAGEAFESLRAAAREAVGGVIAVEESEVPDGFPYPRTSVCGALANDSAVIGADGGLYRCGLQVSEPHRRVGQLAQRQVKLLPMLRTAGEPAEEDSAWWTTFDPTQLPTCSRCSFLPVCWAGCPKRHLDRDAEAIAEQGAYWRRNLARLVAEGTGERLERHITIDSALQFRE